MKNSSSKLPVLERPQVKDVEKIHFTEASVEDGAAMWHLVKDSGVLDVNSPYKYLMMSKFFKSTCVVAKIDDELAGFVTAFKPPEKQDTVFVWQIGVSKEHRGKGIATKILNELLKLDGCKEVNYLEATVSPSNIPSESLFRGLASKRNTNVEVSECFSEEDFPSGSNHEPEMTFRIGPLK